MRSPSFSFKINLGLFFSALIMIFSGLLLQVKYHLGNHGNIVTKNNVFGLDYYCWSSIHKISIVILSLVMIFHVYLHWKWYSAVIKKRLVSKNKQVLMLSVLFVLVAVTGFIPWVINLLEGNLMVRKAFIEVHDKLAIVLSVYIILHIVKRLKWFFTTFEKIKINTAHNTL
jgi:hypothetical protein